MPGFGSFGSDVLPECWCREASDLPWHCWCLGLAGIAVSSAGQAPQAG